MPNIVVGDQLIDFLARQGWLVDVFPTCGSILRAGLVEPKLPCGTCHKQKKERASVKPHSRDRFRDCLVKADATVIQELKARLGASELTVYTRSTGKLRSITL